MKEIDALRNLKIKGELEVVEETPFKGTVTVEEYLKKRFGFTQNDPLEPFVPDLFSPRETYYGYFQLPQHSQEEIEKYRDKLNIKINLGVNEKQQLKEVFGLSKDESLDHYFQNLSGYVRPLDIYERTALYGPDSEELLKEEKPEFDYRSPAHICSFEATSYSPYHWKLNDWKYDYRSFRRVMAEYFKTNQAFSSKVNLWNNSYTAEIRFVREKSSWTQMELELVKEGKGYRIYRTVHPNVSALWTMPTNDWPFKGLPRRFFFEAVLRHNFNYDGVVEDPFLGPRKLSAQGEQYREELISKSLCRRSSQKPRKRLLGRKP